MPSPHQYRMIFGRDPGQVEPRPRKEPGACPRGRIYPLASSGRRWTTGTRRSGCPWARGGAKPSPARSATSGLLAGADGAVDDVSRRAVSVAECLPGESSDDVDASGTGRVAGACTSRGYNGYPLQLVGAEGSAAEWDGARSDGDALAGNANARLPNRPCRVQNEATPFGTTTPLGPETSFVTEAMTGPGLFASAGVRRSAGTRVPLGRRLGPPVAEFQLLLQGRLTSAKVGGRRRVEQSPSNGRCGSGRRRGRLPMLGSAPAGLAHSVPRAQPSLRWRAAVGRRGGHCLGNQRHGGGWPTRLSGSCGGELRCACLQRRRKDQWTSAS